MQRDGRIEIATADADYVRAAAVLQVAVDYLCADVCSDFVWCVVAEVGCDALE